MRQSGVVRMMAAMGAIGSVLAAGAARAQDGGPTGTERAAPGEPGRAWVRACTMAVAPLEGPTPATVFACEGEFDATRGRYLGRAPVGLIAAIDERTGLVAEHDPASLALVSLAHRDLGATRARGASGDVLAVGVSPDRARVATIENVGPDAFALVVRSLPGLREMARARLPSFGGPREPPVVGFLADTPVFTLPARPQEPGYRGIARVQPDGTTAFVPGLESPFRLAAFSPSGATVALVRVDGRIDVVSMDRARRLASVSGGPDLSFLAVSDDGALLAAATHARMTLRRRTRDGYVRIFDHADSLEAVRFSPTGDRLFVGTGTEILAVPTAAPGALPSATGATPPGLTPPADWTAGVIRERILTFPGHDGESHAEWGLAAAFRHAEQFAEVRVFVTDADELAVHDAANAWGRAVAARYEPYSPLDTAADRRAHRFRVQVRPSGERTLEMHVEGDGCDPVERWVQITERAGTLVRTVLSVPEGLATPRQIEAWRRAFSVSASAP